MLFIFAHLMLSKLLFSAAICLTAFHACCQDSIAHRMAVNIGIHRGFLIAHRPLIIPLQQDHISGMEINLVLNPDGSKKWHREYGFPQLGLALSVFDLGNRNELGTSVAVIPYLDFPLLKGKNTNLDLKFGWGLGYVEKIFNADENYKNVAIGSHLNYALILQPRFKTRISEKFAVSAGLSLSHFSNGSIATPNLGLNLLSVTGGISYKFGVPVVINSNPFPVFTKSRNISFFIAAAMKQVYPADGKNYYAFTFSANRSWQVSRKSAFGFGLDVFYDNSISQKLEERNIELNNSLETLRPGLHGSYELVISDLSLIINMGGYMYSKLKNDGSLYHRIGLRYRVNEKVFALMQLKSHWGKADFIEWGVGYRIDKFKSK